MGTAAEPSAGAPTATQRLCLKLLGVPLMLHGECAPLIQQARNCFGRYVIPDPPPNALQLRICPRGNLWRARFEDRSETLDLAAGWPRIDDLLQIIVERERADLAFIHGCCISCAGEGAALVGATTTGKTTLGLALQHAGCAILAEDVIPLSLQTAEAFYYRTGIVARRHTKQMMRSKNAPLAYRDALPPEHERRVPVRTLFFLQAASEPADSTVSVAEGIGQYENMMRLCYGEKAPVRRHPTQRLPIRRPDSFARGPKLAACSASQALTLFFKHLHPAPAPAISRLPALARFLTLATPLLLYPGYLDQTVGLVLREMNERTSPQP